MWKYANPNPKNKHVGDCVIRAVSLAFDKTWVDAYMDIIAEGLRQLDMPSANHVWATYLLNKGCRMADISPLENWTIASFTGAHPEGTYILATGSHVVTVIDGDYYDTWDSGSETPIFVFWKEM